MSCVAPPIVIDLPRARLPQSETERLSQIPNDRMRRNVVSQPVVISERRRAQAALLRIVGKDWKKQVCTRHNLVFHSQYLFCTTCGAHAKSYHHMHKLKAECVKPMPKAAVWSRLKFLMKGEEPLAPHDRLEYGAIRIGKLSADG